MEDQELDIPVSDLQELIPIVRYYMKQNYNNYWLFHTCSSGAEYGINFWENEYSRTQGFCAAVYEVDSGGSAITASWKVLATEGKVIETDVKEIRMFDVEYQLEGPLGNIVEYSVIVNGEDTVIQFAKKLEILALIEEGYFALKIKSMTPL